MKIKTMFALAVTFLPAIGNALEVGGYVKVMQSPDGNRPCLFFKLTEQSPKVTDKQRPKVTIGTPEDSSDYYENYFAVHEGTHYYNEIAGMLTAAYHDGKKVTVGTPLSIDKKTYQTIEDCSDPQASFYPYTVNYVRY